MPAELLPDSRLAPATAPKGAVHSAALGWMVPVFCANCGKSGGLVPQENMTFAFYLCQLCADAHGEIAGTMAVPDEVFWEEVKQEQLDAHGRLLSGEELVRVVEANSSPLATLINKGR